MSRVTPQASRSTCFSPDSRILAWITTSGNSVQAWDLMNDRALRSPPARAFSNIHNLAFLPDSRRVVFVDVNQSAQVWDVVTGQRAFSFGEREPAATNGVAVGGHIALSSDGAWLAGGNPGRMVSVWNTQTKKLIGSLPEGTATVWCLAWSPDRKRLAVGFSDGSLVIWRFPKIRSQLAELGLGW